MLPATAVLVTPPSPHSIQAAYGESGPGSAIVADAVTARKTRMIENGLGSNGVTVGRTFVTATDREAAGPLSPSSSVARAPIDSVRGPSASALVENVHVIVPPESSNVRPTLVPLAPQSA